MPNHARNSGGGGWGARPPWWLFLLAASGVVLLACNTAPRGTAWYQGQSLLTRVVELQLVEEVRYKEEEQHYLIRPREPGKQLAALRMEVRNSQSNVVVFSIGPEAIQLRDESRGEYQALDPLKERVEVPEAGPLENRYTPFIWGDVEMPGGTSQEGQPISYELKGWVLFEVPRGARFTQVVWDAGDVVYMYF